MLGYRKHSFSKAHALLRNLRINLEDLETLRELQKLLLFEIVRTEENIRGLKSEIRKIADAKDTVTAKRLGYLNNRIEGFRLSSYVWRCFGDAIAFLYLDKFSLKQCFYSTETPNPKQTAGFISGKEGLPNEVALLESALQHGVPAVLCDLTNTIRHGDVCLLGGSDPCLIEVKLGKKMNSRGIKQKRSLEKLNTFYQTDSCSNLRGFPALQRRSNRTPEKTYVDVMNECIRESMTSRQAIRQPEHGLHYLVLTKEAPKLDDILKALGLKNAVWPFFLNQHKSDRTWAPYFPFMLSIEDPDHIWNFIRGNLFIFVFVELDALCRIALDEGCTAMIDFENQEYPLFIETPACSRIGISSHILARIGMEFVSPQWIVLSSLERLGPDGV